VVVPFSDERCCLSLKLIGLPLEISRMSKQAALRGLIHPFKRECASFGGQYAAPSSSVQKFFTARGHRLLPSVTISLAEFC